MYCTLLYLFCTDCHAKPSCVCLPPPADLVYWGIHLQCWQEVHKTLLTRLPLCVTVHLLLHSHLAGSAPVLRSAGRCYGDASEWTGADRRPAVSHLRPGGTAGLVQCCHLYGSTCRSSLHTAQGFHMPLHNLQYDQFLPGAYFCIVVFILQEMQLYVSNARGDKEQGPDNAYDRPFVQLDLADLFKQPRPTP